MKAAVLDEDRSGVDAGERAAGHEQPRHVGFEGLGVVDRPLAVVEFDARPHEQIGVGPIADLQENGVCGQLLRPLRSPDQD